MHKTGRLQNYYYYTVQVCDFETGAVKGTGVVVWPGGEIVTCRHVIEEAGVNASTGARKPHGIGALRAIGRLALGRGTGKEPSAPIGIRIRGTDRQYTKVLPANLVAAHGYNGASRDYDDDVVVLRLIDEPNPLGPEVRARLGAANECDGHKFHTFGYRRTGQYMGMTGDGSISGYVDTPRGRRLKGRMLLIKSQDIDQGMSGAGVLDVEESSNLVVGIVSETRADNRQLRGRDSAWAVEASVLGLSPFNLQLQAAPYVIPSRSPIAAASGSPARAAGSNPMQLDNSELYGAPALPSIWANRTEELEGLASQRTRRECMVLGLVGRIGEGKSCLVRKWLEVLAGGPASDRPAGVFWWTFGGQRNLDLFWEALARYLRVSWEAGGPGYASKGEFFAHSAHQGDIVLVLDGLQAAQTADGGLTESDILDFLSWLSTIKGRSTCVLTTRKSVIDLQSMAYYTEWLVPRLGTRAGRDLLREYGVQGTDAELDSRVEELQGHVMTLVLTYASARPGSQ